MSTLRDRLYIQEQFENQVKAMSGLFDEPLMSREELAMRYVSLSDDFDIPAYELKEEFGNQSS